MTDQELLERAARAAGNEAKWSADDPFKLGSMLLPSGQYWNPLDDDGDAFRLAVKLSMNVQMYRNRIMIESPDLDDEVDEVYREDLDDPWVEEAARAAARRAIVRAAAMMWRE